MMTVDAVGFTFGNNDAVVDVAGDGIDVAVAHDDDDAAKKVFCFFFKGARRAVSESISASAVKMDFVGAVTDAANDGVETVATTPTVDPVAHDVAEDVAEAVDNVESALARERLPNRRGITHASARHGVFELYTTNDRISRTKFLL